MKFNPNYNSWFLNDVKRAIQKYHMIEDGDLVAVSLSGGKDSLALLFILYWVKRTSRISFDLCAIHADMGFPEGDKSLFRQVEEFSKAFFVPFYKVPTEIYRIVFQERKEQNPCSLCAALRKGAVYEKARELGVNKVALGHHLDDVAETFFMNMLYHHRLSTFTPKIDMGDLTVIRPMIYLEERTIKRLGKSMGFPVYPSACPQNGNSKRQEMKDFLAMIKEKDENFLESVLKSLENVDEENLWYHYLK